LLGQALLAIDVDIHMPVACHVIFSRYAGNIQIVPYIINGPKAAALISRNFDSPCFVWIAVWRIPMPFDFCPQNVSQAQPGVDSAVSTGKCASSLGRIVGRLVNAAGHAMIKDFDMKQVG